MVKKRKNPPIKQENESLLTDTVLSRLKREATEASKQNDAAKFFLAEKKIMLIGLSYAVRYMATMSKSKKKADLGHVRDALLGTLHTIMQLDENYPEIEVGEEEERE